MLARGNPNIGFAELLYYKGEVADFGDAGVHPNDISHVMYQSALTCPIPLQEIDSPYDIYKMYADGALLIKDLLDENEPEYQPLLKEIEDEPLFTLQRYPRPGDIILIHYASKKTTKVMMLSGVKTYKDITLRFFRASKEKNYPLCMLDLADHKGFQHVWNGK